MKEFYAEVKEKKAIAASARRRVCGSKTKHVSLPSDGMTHAEWKRRNGAVTTYNLKQPTTWAGLKAMPADLQKQYLEGLQRDYKANTLVISQRLGVGAPALRTLAASIGVTFPRGGGGRMSDVDTARWQAFLLGNVAPIVVEAETKETPTEPAPEKPRATLLAGTVTLQGSAGDILQQVNALLGDRCGRVTVTWEFDKEM